jgi:alkanesulfonate monooxygenase SsuD/methylene tetrahydromethanopterin reductase-like flavin-dependent oxidoreductase (luciferase family)
MVSERSKPMHYGLTLPNGGTCGDICLLTELGCLAEAAGWDGVFLEDYIVHQGAGPIPTCDPWMALAALAVQTTRVRLGTCVTPLSRRRPWKIAREAVALDHLSHGRFILGVGLGDEQEAGFAHVGEILDVRHRAKRLDEALEIVTGLWSGKPFGYQGEHFHLDTVTFLPTPLQQPRIPIWVGGGWPRMGPALRAARYDGSLLFPVKHPSWTPEEARALKAFLERHRTDATPYDLVFSPPSDENPKTVRALAEAGMTWCTEYLPASSPEHMRARIARGPQRIV